MINDFRRIYSAVFLGVECQVGEKEPRSVLLLSYKQHVTPVHV